MQTVTTREWLAQGPFGLALSAGYFGFFAHAGMLGVLEDEGLLPARISGASAGAIVAAAWAAGLEAAALRQALLALQRRDFWDPWPGLGLLRGRRLERLLRTILPTTDFAACRVPVRISTHDVLGRRTRVLQDGDLPRAVRASSAVPFLFHPVWIAGRPHLDGGLSDRPALAGHDAAERILLHELPSRKGTPPAAPRPGLIRLHPTALPRLGPFRLEEGERALDAAAAATLTALDEPILR